MSRVSRFAPGLIAVVIALIGGGTAMAGEQYEVPPRELPSTVDRWNRGPINLADEDARRGVVADVPETAAPPAFPVKFQAAERQTAERQAAERQTMASTAIVPDASPKTLPLAPLSDSRPGGGTGEVPSLVTGAASLGIVLGLFLLVALVVRRGMPKHAAVLPREAVEVLGRAPLVGKQQVHLVRCGNKILLVCASTSEVKTLTEITDPSEVERLVEICQQSHGAGAAFRQVLEQFDNAPQALAYPSRPHNEELDFGRLDAATFRRKQESHA